jgi:hypothetical protein
MLPDRSKRYASNAGEIPRLGLATPWQLVLIAALVLSLLFLIFPKSALIKHLYEQGRLDELSLSYIENLYRADSRNADAAILLAKYRVDEIDLKTLEAMLSPFQNSPDLRQRTQVRFTLVQAYNRALSEHPSRTQFLQIQQALSQLMLQAEKDTLPELLVRQLSMLAYRLELPQLGERYMARFAGAMNILTLEQYGREALARQEYVLAARFFLMARDRASQLDEARRLFQLGIGALMAGNLYQLALSSADQHLGNLDNDLPTLRYMARTALAAGEPSLAVRYARRLVFTVSPQQARP